jgi:hypothetical protein
VLRLRCVRPATAARAELHTRIEWIPECRHPLLLVVMWIVGRVPFARCIPVCIPARCAAISKLFLFGIWRSTRSGTTPCAALRLFVCARY